MHLSNFQIFLLISIIKIAVVLGITLTAVAYTVLLERKVLGRLQNRWGPSRVGPFWLLQPLAVESVVKRKAVAVHAGAWAGGASDAAGAKAESAAADAVKVLRERAGRLLRR